MDIRQRRAEQTKDISGKVLVVSLSPLALLLFFPGASIFLQRFMHSA